MPNGLVYVFGHSVYLNARLGTVRYVTEIRDPFNNTLTFAYFNAPGPLDGVAQITQNLRTNNQARVVTFTYDTTGKNALRTMTFDGKVWTYTHDPAGPPGFSVLRTVQPPIGPSWTYEYGGMTGELTKLTTPAGGWLTYTYTNGNVVRVR